MNGRPPRNEEPRFSRGEERSRPMPENVSPRPGPSDQGTPMDMQTALSIASDYGHVPQRIDGAGDPNDANPVGIWAVPTEQGWVEMGQLMQPGAGWNEHGDKYGYGGPGPSNNGAGDWNRPVGGSGGGGDYGGQMPAWAARYDGNPYTQGPARSPAPAAAPSAMSNPDYPYSPNYRPPRSGTGAMAGANVGQPAAQNPAGAVLGQPAAPSPNLDAAAARMAAIRERLPGAGGNNQGGMTTFIPTEGQVGNPQPPIPQQLQQAQPGLPRNPQRQSGFQGGPVTAPPRRVQWPLPPGSGVGFAPTPFATPAAPRPQDPPAPQGAAAWTSLNTYNPPQRQGEVADGAYHMPNDQFQLTQEQQMQRARIYGQTAPDPNAYAVPQGPQPRSVVVEMDDGSTMLYDTATGQWSFR